MAARPDVVPGLVSVIVPSPGPTAVTRRSLAALFRHTRPPFELIAVSRGAADAATGYLAGLRDAASVRVEVVAAPEARGTRAAWHRGLAHARGGLVALLGHGVVVTDAWLQQLVALLGVAPGLGLAGPMANAAPGLQRVDPALAPSDGEDLDAFADRWRAARRGRWFTVDVPWGGCLLVRREILDGAGAARAVRAEGLRPRRPRGPPPGRA